MTTRRKLALALVALAMFVIAAAPVYASETHQDGYTYHDVYGGAYGGHWKDDDCGTSFQQFDAFLFPEQPESNPYTEICHSEPDFATPTTGVPSRAPYYVGGLYGCHCWQHYVLNDTVDSIDVVSIPNGSCVSLYQNTNYGGTAKQMLLGATVNTGLFDSSIGNFPGNWASSIKVTSCPYGGL